MLAQMRTYKNKNLNKPATAKTGHRAPGNTSSPWHQKRHSTSGNMH